MIFNVTSGGGGSGAALTVTAPAGVTVTVSKDGKTKTRTADSAGNAVFKGLETGVWTLTITDGTQTASRQVTITSDYTAAVSFFQAAISVTYPAGAQCTCSDGVTTLTAPDTSGSAVFTIPSAGAWTVTAADGEKTISKTVSIAENGQAESVDATKQYLYDHGDEFTALTGGWEISGNYAVKGADTVTVGSKTATKGYMGSAKTKKTIDVSGFSVLELHFTEFKGNTSQSKLFVYVKDSGGATLAQANASAADPNKSDFTVTVDISGISAGIVEIQSGFAGDVSRYVYATFDTVRCY